MIDGTEEEVEVMEVEEVERREEEVCDIAHISLNVVAGISDDQTMRVKGIHGKRALFILIYTCSIHNFMDQEIADKFGCQLLPTGLTRVSVVDGSRLAVSAKINNSE